MYDYKINKDYSYVGYRLEGSSEVVKIAYYGSSDWNGVDDKQKGKGTAKMKLESGMGDIFVTSIIIGRAHARRSHRPMDRSILHQAGR